MKKLNENELALLEGGIRWREFASGFCDGLTISAFFVGGPAGAASVGMGCLIIGKL